MFVVSIYNLFSILLFMYRNSRIFWKGLFYGYSIPVKELEKEDGRYTIHFCIPHKEYYLDAIISKKMLNGHATLYSPVGRVAEMNFVDNVMTGDYKQYRDGKLCEEGTLADFVRDGEFMEYNDGIMLFRGEYKNNKKHGQAFEFDQSGFPLYVGEYDEGIRVSPEYYVRFNNKKYKCCLLEGNRILRGEFNSSSKFHGLCVEVDENNNPIELSYYRNDVKVCHLRFYSSQSMIEYNEQGSIAYVGGYEKYPSLWYPRSGQGFEMCHAIPIFRGSFYRDVREGVGQAYYYNQSLLYDGYWKNGQINGYGVCYCGDGRIFGKGEWTENARQESDGTIADLNKAIVDDEDLLYIFEHSLSFHFRGKDIPTMVQLYRLEDVEIDAFGEVEEIEPIPKESEIGDCSDVFTVDVGTEKLLQLLRKEVLGAVISTSDTIDEGSDEDEEPKLDKTLMVSETKAKVPQPLEPQTIQHQPVEPHSIQPQPLEPQPIQPQPIQPQPIQPQPLEPQPLEPHSIQPQPLQPQLIQPQTIQPHSIQPQSIQPQLIQHPPTLSQSTPRLVQPKHIPSQPLQPQLLQHSVPQLGQSHPVMRVSLRNTNLRNEVKESITDTLHSTGNPTISGYPSEINSKSWDQTNTSLHPTPNNETSLEENSIDFPIQLSQIPTDVNSSLPALSGSVLPFPGIRSTAPTLDSSSKNLPKISMEKDRQKSWNEAGEFQRENLGGSVVAPPVITPGISPIPSSKPEINPIERSETPSVVTPSVITPEISTIPAIPLECRPSQVSIGSSIYSSMDHPINTHQNQVNPPDPILNPPPTVVNEIPQKGQKFFDSGALFQEGEFQNGKLNGENGVEYWNPQSLSYPANSSIQPVMHYRGNWKDGKLEGKGEEFSMEGKLVYSGTFHLGVYDGIGQFYGNTDHVIKEGNFKNGLLNGNGKKLDEESQLILIGQFQNDQLEGEGEIRLLSSNHLLKQGTFSGNEIIRGKMYDPLTQVVSKEGSFRNGRLNGNGIEYYPNGSVFCTGNFYYGELRGNAKIYRENGQLSFSGTIQNQQANGYCEFFDERGFPLQKGEFQNGIGNGEMELYDRGKLVWKGTMQNGLKEGNGVEWDENGRLIFKGFYQANEPETGLAIGYMEKEMDRMACLLQTQDREPSEKVLIYAVDKMGPISWDETWRVVYEGQWENDEFSSNIVKSGNGNFFLSDGRVIQAVWENDTIQQGTVIRVFGPKATETCPKRRTAYYDGTVFFDDSRSVIHPTFYYDGSGRFNYEDGSFFQGTWRNGELTEFQPFVFWPDGTPKYQGFVKKLDLEDPKTIHEYIPSGVLRYFPRNSQFVLEGTFSEEYNCILNPVRVYDRMNRFLAVRDAQYSMESDGYNVNYTL